MTPKKDALSFRDLTKSQLISLKERYVESRLNSMTTTDLKKFVKEVLDLQISGTVGNDEEREVWKEMREHFNEDFEQQIKEVLKSNTSEDNLLTPEEQEFQKRLDTLEKNKQGGIQGNQDMW